MKERKVAKKLAKASSWRPHESKFVVTRDLNLYNLTQLFDNNHDASGHKALETRQDFPGTGITVSATRSRTQEFPTIVLHADLQEGHPSTTMTLRYTFLAMSGLTSSPTQSIEARLVRPGIRKTWATPFGPAHHDYKTLVGGDAVTFRVTVSVPQEVHLSTSQQQQSDLIHAVMTGATPEVFSTTLFVYKGRNRRGALSGLDKVQIIPERLAKAAQTTWVELVERGQQANFWKERRGEPKESDRPRAHWNDADSDLEEVQNDKEYPFIECMLWGADNEPTTGNILAVVGASATTMKAVAFCAMSDFISFKPLSSRGPEEQRRFLRNFHGEPRKRAAPASCKSVYRVATILGMQELRLRALAFFLTELSEKNVLSELFDKFTSEYDEVREVVIGVAINHWAQLKGSPELDRKVEELATGKMPHAAAVWSRLIKRLDKSVDLELVELSAFVPFNFDKE